MNEAKLRKLIQIFEESGVEEMEYSESFWRGIRVRFGRRKQAPEASAVHLQAPAPPPLAQEPAAVPPAAAQRAPDENLHVIRSPMVGSFFRASSPDADPFSQEGDRVTIGQTLCIIEAMKIMNEIVADAAGEIVEIVVANGDPVEYNQPLVTLRTD